VTDTAADVPLLVLGPLIRHVSETTVTVWMETGHPARVSVRTASHRGDATTFTVHGHHYAVVDVTGLPPGSAEPYEVWVEDADVGPSHPTQQDIQQQDPQQGPQEAARKAWPPPRSGFPPSTLRTLDPSRPLRLVFGSCRESLPHDHVTNRRYGVDALRGLSLRLAQEGPPGPDDPTRTAWPSMLLFLGDQVYADETSNGMRDFIASRRDIAVPPGEEIADYDEYAYLYRLAWTEPTVRWLLSTLPSAMVFDDHDVRDDWNTSHTWREQMHAHSWWHHRIVGGLASYWVYQHLGNLSPAERRDDRVWRDVQEASAAGRDAGEVLDTFGDCADADPGCYRWSYARDIGGTRLVVIDSRAGRVLDPERRAMLDDDEERWLEGQMTGGHDHLLLATSLPFLLPIGLHHMEAWNEAVAGGAWGDRHRGWGEAIRQTFDLEHWAAFQRSFQRLAALSADVAAGRRGSAPATVMWLAGDVHHSYLAEALLPAAGDAGGNPGGDRSPEQAQGRLLQAVCSPIRNPLPRSMRFVTAALAYGLANAMGIAVARSAKVPAPPWRWKVRCGPWFDNSLATLDLDGRHATLSWQGAVEGPSDDTLRWRRLHRIRLS
jgi:hypothetical protein